MANWNACNQVQRAATSPQECQIGRGWVGRPWCLQMRSHRVRPRCRSGAALFDGPARASKAKIQVVVPQVIDLDRIHTASHRKPTENLTVDTCAADNYRLRGMRRDEKNHG